MKRRKRKKSCRRYKLALGPLALFLVSFTLIWSSLYQNDSIIHLFVITKYLKRSYYLFICSMWDFQNSAFLSPKCNWSSPFLFHWLWGRKYLTFIFNSRNFIIVLGLKIFSFSLNQLFLSSCLPSFPPSPLSTLLSKTPELIWFPSPLYGITLLRGD